MKTKIASIAALVCAATTCLHARETLWTVGTADKSSKEFALHQIHRQWSEIVKEPVRYVISQDSATSWPAIHPGPKDAWAGSTKHPMAISFELSSIPAKQCELVIETIAEHPTAGQLQASINGIAANIHMPGGCGDQALNDDTKGCPQSRRLSFHPSLLKAGPNEITLTVTNGSWFIYDTVHLDVADEEATRVVKAPEIQPSPCLLKQNDKLVQVVRLKVANSGLPAATQAVTRVGDSEITTDLQLAFGDNTFELPVPRVEKPTSLTVTLKIDNSVVSSTGTLNPQAELTIFACPSIHTDIGYTDTQANVLRRHNENLDRVVEMCAGNPLFKWNIEVAWELRNYFEARPPEAKDKLIGLLKEGRLGLQAGYLNMLTALMSDEAMNRYAQYAGELHRAHGITVSSAILTDVPTATWSVPSAFAASGVKYFAEGSNQTRGPVLKHSEKPAPFYWEGPDGSRVLAMLCDGYAQSRWVGNVGNISEMQDHVGHWVRAFTHDKYPYDAIYLYGAGGDNDKIDDSYGRLVKEWNEKWASPKIVISTGPEYFEYIEKKYGASLPVKRGDFGGFWEDGAGSTMQETIQHMASQHRAATAETLWAMARIAGKSAEYPLKKFENAWHDILMYAEHTWGAAQSISDPDAEMTKSQWAVKAEYAHRPDKDTRELLQDGLTAYAGGETGNGFVVVNPTSWDRSGVVEVPKSFPQGTVILDDAGKAFEIQDTAKGRAFHAADVPGFGSKHYRVEMRSGLSSYKPHAHTDLENKHYKIQFKSGEGVVSITDKQSKSELVDKSGPWKFGQVVYAAGGEQSSLMEDHISTVPEVVVNDGNQDGLKTIPGKILLTGAVVKEILAGERGPLFEETIIRSSAPAMPDIETRVRLYQNEKRLSYDIQITSKTEIRAKEGVYVAFPVAAKDPKFRLGMTNAVALPEKDFLHGGCHEWYCVQDFVSCSDGTGGPEVVWSSPDAPLVTLGQVNSGRWQSDFDAKTPTIFSYVMNNYWMTNYKAGQDGDFLLRYEITSNAKPASNAECVRFARECAVDMIATPGKQGKEKGLSVSGDAIVATAVSDPEDKKAVLLRLRNCDSTKGTATVSGDLRQAAEYNLTGAHLQELKPSNNTLKIDLKPQQVKTIRLIPRQRVEADNVHL